MIGEHIYDYYDDPTFGQVSYAPCLDEPINHVHDLAVFNETSSKTIVGIGYNQTIGVTVANRGDYTEISKLTVYANSTAMGAFTDVTILARNSATLTAVWNTSGFANGDYILTCVVDPVPGETAVLDNNYTSTTIIHIGVPGDISGPTPGVYDGTCNMRDVQYLILLFNTYPSSPNWNPNADINNDGTVNMRDIQIAILNFNKHE